MVVVTGGAKGLGFAIASEFISRNAKVIVADLDGEAISRLSKAFETIKTDVTDPRSVQNMVDQVIERHGQIDILINNAGVIFSAPFVNVMNPNGIMHNYDAFSQNLKVNLDSVFIVTRAVVEQMVRKRTGGAIVNISSISGRGNEGQTAYSAAKGAVNAMTVTWAKELGRWGIRVNAIAPGFIDTPSTNSAVSPTVVEHVKSNTPLGRLGKAEEVAHAVTSIVENEFISGAIVDVNGGLSF